jgi:hypothetical protein
VPTESPSNKEADHNVRTKLADATGYPLSRRPIPPQWAHLVRPVNLIRAPYVPVPTGTHEEITGPGRQKLTNRAREHLPAHTM